MKKAANSRKPPSARRWGRATPIFASFDTNWLVIVGRSAGNIQQSADINNYTYV
jgi:hypothetical protein